MMKEYVLKGNSGYLSAFRTDGGGVIMTTEKRRALRYTEQEARQRVKDYPYEGFEIEEY